MNIGKAVKNLRSKAGVSQMDFAKACGISQTSLSQIETQKKRPSQKTVKKICDYFSITESWLYILAAELDDVPKEKKKLFKVLYPHLESMIMQLFHVKGSPTKE